ncbi:MFS transporter [Acidisphaera sp. L21]|uniref:MFS transporter n=1 Tax=Acidisphaera sp. L21 TaxID=1641851 RepID=UPI00131D9B1A|nr:MFS transporter [Acidisphaera sp. L21]
MQQVATSVGALDSDSAGALYRKIAWRIMPLVLLCYVANYIDRTNIGIAQLSLRKDLGFSEQVYGIGVGLFFIGFILFEVPSNMLLDRIGARKTLLRIMVGWGVVSAATAFVRTPYEFYAARILLGMAEAGFFPGILLYLTYWFPSARRTRMTAMFFMGLPLSGIIGSPLSGWIMHSFPGVYGLREWQWLFLLEGVPSIVLGVAAFYVLQDRPADATWLSPAEKAIVAADIAAEQSAKGQGGHGSLLEAFRNPRVYVLGLVGCGTYTLANAVSFWSPLIISASGVKDVLNVGLLAGIAPLIGVIAMVIVGWHSDKTLERRWHAACSEFVAAAALVALSLTVGSPYLTVVLIAIMTAGHYCGLTVFWSIPSVYLSDRAKAGGIAITTAFGSTAAALTPAMLGWIRVETGSLSLGLQISAAIITMGGLVLLIGVPARVLRERA